MTDPLFTEKRSAEQRQKVVLLIEDDFLIRWQAAEYLRETGFGIIEAVSAGEALAAIRARSVIDAIFCSACPLPAEEPELFRYLDERHPRLPIVVALRPDAVSRLTPLPTRATVTKPYVMSEVDKHLRGLLAVGSSSQSLSEASTAEDRLRRYT